MNCPHCLLNNGILNAVEVGHQCVSADPCAVCGSDRLVELWDLGPELAALRAQRANDPTLLQQPSAAPVYVVHPCPRKSCASRRHRLVFGPGPASR
jgi:hypothetical protein